MMDERLKRIAEHYGIVNQWDKTQEELGELDRELDKYYYHFPDDGDARDCLTEEIADVYNMLDQIVYLLDIKSEVDRQRDFKIKRQLGRIAAEKDK